MRRDREHAARDFQADIAVDAGRNADRAAAIGGVRDRHHARRDHRRTAGGRAAGRVVGIPGISRDIDGRVLRRAADAELRRRRAAHQIETGLAHLRGEVRVGDGTVAAHEQRALLLQPARHGRAEILHQERQAGKRTLRIGAGLDRILDCVGEHFDDAAQFRIDLGNALGGLPCEFRGGQLAAFHTGRERHAIMPGPLVPAHHQSHCCPILRAAIIMASPGRDPRSSYCPAARTLVAEGTKSINRPACGSFDLVMRHGLPPFRRC